MDERNERRRKLSEQEKKNLDRQQRKEREIQQKKARRDAKYREQARAEARKKGMDSHIVVEIPAQPVKRKKKPKKKTLPDIIEKETDKKVRDLDPTDHKDGYYVNEVGVRKATAEKQKKRRKKAQPKPVSPKQRRRRRIIAYASIFTAVMIIGVVLSMTVLFKTEHIEVKGNKYYEDSMIIDLSGVQKGDNIFSATLFANTDKVTKTLPYIKDASIGFSIPDGLIITVHNREPYYSLKSGDDYFLVSEENRILEKIDEKPKGLMFIEAPKLKNADVGGYVKFDKERYTNAVEEIISCLHKNGYEDITGISVKNINDITITYDNRIVIKLGLPDDLDYKIRTAFTIITKNLDPNNAKTIMGILNVSNCNNGSKKSYFREVAINDSETKKKKKKKATEATTAPPTEESTSESTSEEYTESQSEDYSSDATDPTYEEYPTDDTGYDSSTDYTEATESTDYSYDYSVDTNDYGEPDYGYYGE